jgi:two-component system NarL family response regulator
LEATRLITAELPKIKIVMLTTSAEESDLFEALKSGASGYLLKNLKPNVLFNYLQGLTRGEAPLSRELSTHLLAEFNRQAAALEEHSQHLNEPSPEDVGELPADAELEEPMTELTPRQRQILEMIVDGLSYKEVGAALHISENTVKYHMGEILMRLHARNREQVVAYALRSGLLRRTESYNT